MRINLFPLFEKGGAEGLENKPNKSIIIRESHMKLSILLKKILFICLITSMFVSCSSKSDIKESDEGKPRESTETYGDTAFDVETPFDTAQDTRPYEYAPDALHKAVHEGDLEKVEAILKTNPDVDARDITGGTALHTAMFQTNMDIVTALIKHGYDVNAKDTVNGYTPLHYAVWANNIEATKILLANKADTKIKANDGKTALDKAKTENRPKIADLIMKYTKK